MAEETDAGWAAERAWLHRVLRRGEPVRDAEERRRVEAALARAAQEVGDSVERTATHEAGHAVVARALDWVVVSVEPVRPDGSGAAKMFPPPELTATPEGAAVYLCGRAMVCVAGYLAEAAAHGPVLPLEAAEAATMAMAEGGMDADEAEAFVLLAEAQAGAVLAANGDVVRRLAEAQVAGGEVRGPALFAILADVRRA